MKKYKFVFLDLSTNQFVFANKKHKDWYVHTQSYFTQNSQYGFYQYDLRSYLYRTESRGKELEALGHNEKYFYEIDALRIMLKSHMYSYRQCLLKRKTYDTLGQHAEYYIKVNEKHLANCRKYIKDAKSRIKEIEASKEYMFHVLKK